jgi:hypothetical protein
LSCTRAWRLPGWLLLLLLLSSSTRRRPNPVRPRSTGYLVNLLSPIATQSRAFDVRVPRRGSEKIMYQARILELFIGEGEGVQ